ncbi:hypothetical protein U9M48_016858 [Paspalum notatum var. saurae]|uniref:Uncharacterized protein n=1 Tax=Paspalum notatum var. saurae TaxID=547442 RepID=A0AAQ3T6E7_PASNO
MDRVRNDEIRDRLGVAPIEEKLVQHRLRWFGHVQRKPPEAPVHSGIIRRNNDVKRGKGRPNLTWEEAVKRDLKDWNIVRELALDIAAWKAAIHIIAAEELEKHQIHFNEYISRREFQALYKRKAHGTIIKSTKQTGELKCTLKLEAQLQS